MFGLRASHNLNQSWSISFATQALLNQNLAELWIANADVGIGYRITADLKAELHYRAIKFRTLDNEYQNRSLFYSTLTYSKTLGRFSFSLRNRAQLLVYENHYNDAFKGPILYNRDRLTIKYKVNYYWSPYVSAEAFVPLNHTRRSGIDQWRFAAGFVRTFSDRFSVDIRYQIQYPLQRTTRHINYLTAVNCYIKF